MPSFPTPFLTIFTHHLAGAFAPPPPPPPPLRAPQAGAPFWLSCSAPSRLSAPLSIIAPPLLRRYYRFLFAPPRNTPKHLQNIYWRTHYSAAPRHPTSKHTPLPSLCRRPHNANEQQRLPFPPARPPAPDGAGPCAHLTTPLSATHSLQSAARRLSISKPLLALTDLVRWPPCRPPFLMRRSTAATPFLLALSPCGSFVAAAAAWPTSSPRCPVCCCLRPPLSLSLSLAAAYSVYCPRLRRVGALATAAASFLPPPPELLLAPPPPLVNQTQRSHSALVAAVAGAMGEAGGGNELQSAAPPTTDG